MNSCHFGIVCRIFVDILCWKRFKDLLTDAVNKLDVNQALNEVERFVRNPQNLAVWSREFFLDVATRIKVV